MITEESAALFVWYGSRPEIRQLVAIRDTQGLRVLIHLEPAVDSGEIHATWMAKRHAWISELQVHTGGAVRLELTESLLAGEVDTDEQDVIVASLFWRDPSFI